MHANQATSQSEQAMEHANTGCTQAKQRQGVIAMGGERGSRSCGEVESGRTRFDWSACEMARVEDKGGSESRGYHTS